MTSPGPEHLFVYGTLRAGFPAHHVLAGRAEFAGTGHVPGRLYDTGRYPAAVASTGEGERVRGELYRLPADDGGELLMVLDGYEGHVPHSPERSLFVRVALAVARDDGTRTDAWVYLFNRSVDGLARIASGDYADRD